MQAISGPLLPLARWYARARGAAHYAASPSGRFYWYSFFVIFIIHCSQDGFIGILLYFVCLHCVHLIVREQILVEDTFYWYSSEFCVFSLCSPHPVVFGVTIYVCVCVCV